MKRRKFLQVSGMASTVPMLGGNIIVNAQAQESSTGQLMICLFLRGGN